MQNTANKIRTGLLPFMLKDPMLAVGAETKGGFALAWEDTVWLSPAFGDLEDVCALEAFEKSISEIEKQEGRGPKSIVCDYHPEYLSTKYAGKRAEREGLPCIKVQHHHAHVASAMVECGLSGPVIGVAWDGLGYGLDGVMWGGEFFVGDYKQGFQRAAHLEACPMPGGKQAIKQPWRMAVAYTRNIKGNHPLHQERAKSVLDMIDRNINCPLTTSIGRLFDAVSALIGICGTVSYEGEAAIKLEEAASREKDIGYKFSLDKKAETLVIGTEPLFSAIVGDLTKGISASKIANRFHRGVVDMLISVVSKIAEESGLRDVVLSGGVFLNKYLLELAMPQLEAAGFKVYISLPELRGDGGLALGQIACVGGLICA